MKLKALVAAMGVLAVPYAAADTFDLSLSADDGGRWYEYYSNVYGEIGADAGEITNPGSDDFGFIADGFFDIDSGNKVGGGVVVFPFGGNFLNVGSLTFDGVSGLITDLTLDFDNYIADNDAVTNSGYTTTLSNVSGSVETFNGEVSGINLTSDISFIYDTNFGDFSYDGTFSITDGSFELLVDDSNAVSFLGDYRLVWDVQGDVLNLSPVPEPSVYAMFFAGMALVGAMARRRTLNS